MFNSTTPYNGHFNQKTTIKPIAGFLTHEMYLNNLITGVNDGGYMLLPGQPIVLQTGAKQGSGLAGLNPNVMSMSLPATGATHASSVLIHNINDVVLPGDQAPALRSTQTSYVASVGMGVEIYLQCDLTLLGVDNRIKLYYNISKYEYTTEASGNIQLGYDYVTLTSNVVEGKAIHWDSSGTNTIWQDCYVVKVRL